MADPRKRMTRVEVLLRFAASTVMALALMFLAGAGVMGAWNMFRTLQHASAQEDAARRQLALLEAQDARVRADIERLATERGVEAALRERYGVVRPGEEVIQIVENQGTTSPAEDGSSDGLFSRLLGWLRFW